MDGRRRQAVARQEALELVGAALGLCEDEREAGRSVARHCVDEVQQRVLLLMLARGGGGGGAAWKKIRVERVWREGKSRKIRAVGGEGGCQEED
eukprot:362358-Chlamydomonas_euryale.AAC.2